jgi:hypothetical protein
MLSPQRVKFYPPQGGLLTIVIFGGYMSEEKRGEVLAPRPGGRLTDPFKFRSEKQNSDADSRKSSQLKIKKSAFICVHLRPG